MTSAIRVAVILSVMVAPRRGASVDAAMEVRPVVLTTANDFDAARQRIEMQTEPFIAAWRKMVLQADDVLPVPPDPYLGTDHEQYYRVGTRQGIQARTLALVFRFTANGKYRDKAIEILMAWADEGRQYPFNLRQPSHSAGLVLGRVMVIFADAYALMYGEFDADQRTRIEHWLRGCAGAIRTSQQIWIREQLPRRPPPYLGRQNFNNHLGAQTMGLAAIGYAVRDDALIRYALRDPANPRNLKTLLEGAIIATRSDLYHGDPTLTQGAPDPQRGEMYDRYRVMEGKGLPYCHIHLRFLTLTALMARNNSESMDYFASTGNDVGLESAFGFYSEFLLSGSTAARTGYYREDRGVDFGLLSLFDVAGRVYPTNETIRLVLSARDRVRYDAETFGWTAPLIHGPGDIPVRIGQWDFDEAGQSEGWSLRKSLSGAVRNGAFELQITGRDPGLLSPAVMHVDAAEYRSIHIRMRNETDDSRATVFFTTDKHPSFEGTHVYFEIHPRDGEFREYVVDLGQHSDWSGIVTQVRIDPADAATSGKLQIDSVRLAP